MNAVPPETSLVDHDEDEELVACYRHPNRLTALHCITCERPICTDCAVMASVGQKCPECARLPRTARASAPGSAFVRSGIVAIVLGGIAGYVYWILPLPIIGWIIAGFVGGVIGDLARRAAGGYRSHALARLVAALVALGFAWPAGARLLLDGHVSSSDLLLLVGAAFAAAGAYQRAS